MHTTGAIGESKGVIEEATGAAKGSNGPKARRNCKSTTGLIGSKGSESSDRECDDPTGMGPKLGATHVPANTGPLGTGSNHPWR